MNIKYLELKKNQTDFPCEKISSPEQAADFIKRFYNDDIGIFESCFILLMNRANKTIGYAKISQGGVAGTVIDTKIVAKYVVDFLASGVIIAHNHPSGNINPSEQDIEITKKLKGALNMLDAELLDHLILTEDSFLSMNDRGLC